MDFKPQLIPFSGGEREDFRHFKQMLETYLELTNTTSDSRKLAILRTQVHKSAKTYLDSLKDQYQDNLTFDVAMDALEEKFVTPELLESYKLILNDMRQGTDEHPRDFYSRLQEVARLAKKDDKDIVLMRFRYGLLPAISKHCIEHGSITEQQWLKYAESWWNANKTYGITHNYSSTDVQLNNYPLGNVDSFTMMDSSQRIMDSKSSIHSDPVVTLLERLVTNMETMEKKMNDRMEQLNQSTKKPLKNDNLTSDDIVKIVRNELSKTNRSNNYNNYHGSHNYGPYKNNYGSRRYNNQQYNQDNNYDNNNHNYLPNQQQHQQQYPQQQNSQQLNNQQQYNQQTQSKN
ncbi:hypothetical protein BJ944DRAFT_209095 [Cunninghamella echinulata]|nr:hypothetical protein BJ944DRAFT_209095 [Cunninghamella echinulata]